MGNVISRKKTIKDRILNLENKITKLEYELSSLKVASSTYIFLLLSVVSVPLIGVFLFMFSTTLAGLLSILLILVSYGLSLLLNHVRFIKIKSKEASLSLMKQQRKDLIDLCKNDINYSITKSLIERYDDEEGRESFFKGIQKKRKSGLDSVTDFVLGNDPSAMNALICTKCGVHNGLIDPKNDKFDHFYCFDCKEKNIRKSPRISESK